MDKDLLTPCQERNKHKQPTNKEHHSRAQIGAGLAVVVAALSAAGERR